MRARFPVALLALVVGVSAPALAQDVLMLTNGDRLSGQLVAVAAGIWTFKHAGGDLTIGAADITSFTSGGLIGVRGVPDRIPQRGQQQPAGRDREARLAAHLQS
jgi:hypothetical protein